MKIVLADIEENALTLVKEEIMAEGASVIAVLTDVSKSRDVVTLAPKAFDAFGAVHLLFNNAGVVTPSVPIWENTLSDWNWIIGVNLWGVIHGIQTSFLPCLSREQSAILSTPPLLQD